MNKLVDLKNAPAALTAWFQPILAKWPTQFAGDKPTAAMLAAVVLLDGFKNGSARPGIELLHLAMTLRPAGCTVQQFCTAGSCGPANNRRRRLVKQGLLSVTVTGKPYAFACTVTAKGWQLISSNYTGFKAVAGKPAQQIIQGKPAKAKPAATAKAAKPRPRKPVQVQVPAPMPPPAPTSQGDGSTPSQA